MLPSKMLASDEAGIYFFEVTKPNTEMSTAWVSKSPLETMLPDEFIECTKVLSAVIFVNYRADQKVSTDVFIHELGHAMGMFRHFPGFDNEAKKPVDTNFWPVLQLLYSYRAGTSEADVSR